MGCRIILALAVLAALMFGPIAAIASARWPVTHASALADAASDRIAAVYSPTAEIAPVAKFHRHSCESRRGIVPGLLNRPFMLPCIKIIAAMR